MYTNGKMIAVENIPGMRGREIKEGSLGSEFKYDIVDRYSEPLEMPQCTPPSTTVKKINNKCARGMAQAIQCLPNKCETLNSNPIKE
jgi:hypothetical protein